MFKSLAKLYYQMSRNTIRFAATNLKITYGISALIVGIVVIFASILISGAAAVFPDEFLSLIFSYIFAMLLGFIILLGVPQVFNDMYSSPELEHLFTLPIKTRHIFWIKYSQSFIAVPGFVWLVGVVLITTFGIFSKASFLFYPVAYLTVFSVILIGMAIAYLLNLILVQIIPAHRAKELMTVMSGMAGILAYFAFQLPNYFMIEGEAETSLVNLPQLPSWLPLTWAGNAIAKSKIADMAFIAPFILIILLAVALIFIATTLVERGFRTGWVRLSEGKGRKKKRKRTNNKINNKLSHPIIFIGTKEWLTIKRDLREWLTFLPIVFFMFIPFISLVGNKEIMQEIVKEPLITWSVLQIVFIFAYTMIGSTFAATAIGREGEAYSFARVLPIDSWHFALGKFWISLLIPIIFLSFTQIVLGFLLNWSVWQILLGIVILIFYGAGLTGIGLALGTIGSRFNRDNPQQRLKVGISFLLLFITFIYMALASTPLGLSFFPIEEIVAEEGWDTTSGGLAGFITILVNWKINNVLLVKAIGLLVFIFVTVGTAWLTLFLSTIKIRQGITIDIVSNVKSRRLKL